MLQVAAHVGLVLGQVRLLLPQVMVVLTGGCNKMMRVVRFRFLQKIYWHQMKGNG